MRLKGKVEATVRVERAVLADDLKAGQKLLEQEVYGLLHSVHGVKAVEINLVEVST